MFKLVSSYLSIGVCIFSLRALFILLLHFFLVCSRSLANLWLSLDSFVCNLHPVVDLFCPAVFGVDSVAVFIVRIDSIFFPSWLGLLHNIQFLYLIMVSISI